MKRKLKWTPAKRQKFDAEMRRCDKEFKQWISTINDGQPLVAEDGLEPDERVSNKRLNTRPPSASRANHNFWSSTRKT